MALQALAGASADPEVCALLVDRAAHDDSDWIRQLAVRIASCENPPPWSRQARNSCPGSGARPLP